MRVHPALKGLAFLVIVAGVVMPFAAGAANTAPLTRVSQDRFVDTYGLHQSETQSSLAAAPNSRTLVSAFEVGRVFDGGSVGIGWATSLDGAKSWDHGLLPVTVPEGGPSSGTGFPLYRAADPSVAYNLRFGKWLVSSRGLVSGTGAPAGIYVNSSTDGETWSAPQLVHAAGTGDAPARGSLTCDNTARSAGYGNCYLVYSNSASSPANAIDILTSTDGGGTWSGPVAPADAAVGTGPVAVVQPPSPSAPAGTCGRVVVGYAGSTTNISDVVSSDCGATWPAHTSVATVATHTVAQGLRTSLLPSISMSGDGSVYLAWQTRSFRIAQTTLSAAANAGDTNIKVGSVTGMVAGNTLTVDTGSAAETVTISTVGTSGAGGTGITFTPALAAAHALGAVVTVNGVPSTSTAAPNDIALSVMPGPTDATPAPAFAAPARIPIEADTGATTNTNDHFIPAIAADPSTSGASTHLALFYYNYPVAACSYITGATLDPTQGPQCTPQYSEVESVNNGSSWSAPALIDAAPSLAVLPRSSNGPDLGNYASGVFIPTGPLKSNVISVFSFPITVNGTDESMYVPTHGLPVGP